jgi:hypothetical protein
VLFGWWVVCGWCVGGEWCLGLIDGVWAVLFERLVLDNADASMQIHGVTMGRLAWTKLKKRMDRQHRCALAASW